VRRPVEHVVQGRREEHAQKPTPGGARVTCE
jgi:hypothetical protein